MGLPKKHQGLLLRLRGQSSAPIELVVAIIVMAMSMSLALMVMGQTSTAQCDDQIKAEMRSLSSAMLDVSLGSPPTSRELTVSLRPCGSYNVETIRFVKYATASLCGDCPSASGGCWKLVPVSVNPKTQEYNPIASAITCIDLPQLIELQESTACSQTGTQIHLSTNACPPGIEPNAQNDNCNEGKYGTNYEENKIASWLTFGKQKNEQNYFVQIAKDVPTSQNQVISVCVRAKKK